MSSDEGDCGESRKVEVHTRCSIAQPAMRRILTSVQMACIQSMKFHEVRNPDSRNPRDFFDHAKFCRKNPSEKVTDDTLSRLCVFLPLFFSFLHNGMTKNDDHWKPGDNSYSFFR